MEKTTPKYFDRTQIAQVINDFIEEHKISVASLAKILGITIATVSYYRYGGYPHQETANKYAELMAEYDGCYDNVQRVVPNDELCRTWLDTLTVLYKVITKVQKGKPVTMACQEEGVQYRQFRLFTGIDFINGGNVQGRLTRKMPVDNFASWRDKLMYDICGGWNFVVLPDFDDALAKVSAESLTWREQEVIALRYIKDMTYEECGNWFGVTRERIRQIAAKALRKLRHPRNKAYFDNGLDDVGLNEQERKVQRLRQEKEEAMARLKAEEATLVQSINAIKECCINDAPISVKVEPESIENLELSVRSYNCLKRHGINTIADLAAMSVNNLRNVRNLGRKSFDEICKAMYEKYGITL